MVTLWNSEIIKAISGTVKSGGTGLWLYVSISSETKTMYSKKLVPETVHYIKFIKIYLQSFISIYHLHQSFVFSHLQKYFLQLKHHIELLVHQQSHQYWG